MAKEDEGLGGGREGVAMDGCRRWLRRMGEGRAKRERGMKGMAGQYLGKGRGKGEMNGGCWERMEWCVWVVWRVWWGGWME